VARMEAEMRSAAKELEFERAAALRDEIQQIRLRVLDQDQSAIIARAAELAAQRTPSGSARGSRGGRGRQDVGTRAGTGADAAARAAAEAELDVPSSVLEVASVTVLAAGSAVGGEPEP